MKPLKSPTLYSRLALITSVTLVVGYFVVYAAWTTINPVNTGDTLTKDLINNILSNANDLNDRVSNFGFSAGNVGIGTANPGTYKLYVNDAGSNALALNAPVNPVQRFLVGGTQIWGFIGNYVAPNGLSVYNYNNSSITMQFTSDGKVGIGTPTPSDTLTVNGGVTANTFTSPTGWSAVTVNGAGWTANSVVCRRIGSFLQIKGGYFSLNTCNAVPAWGATVATLPVECRPVSDINYPTGSCWSNLLTSSACFTQINANGTILIYNSNSTCNLSVTGTFPAN